MIKFVPNTTGIKIKGKDGKFSEFAGIANMGEHPVYSILFGNGKHLTCTSNHRLIGPTSRIPISELAVGNRVFRGDGRYTKVKEIIDTGRVETVYDIIHVRDEQMFVAGGVLNSNCAFVTDEETLIEPMCLSRMRTPSGPAFYTKQVRWYIEPMPNRTYMLSLDPSMGTGGDFAAIQVFMLPELIQVAEWQHNNTDPRGQVRIMLELLHTLSADLIEHPEQIGDPEIFWTVENNSVGEAILQIIEDTGEDRFPGTFVSEKKKRGQRRRVRKGLTTSKTNKLSSCARLKSLIESDRMVINSTETLKELKGFIARGASYSAKAGQHDDLVSALLLIVRMLDILIAMGEHDGSDLGDSVDLNEIFNEPMPVVV